MIFFSVNDMKGISTMLATVLIVIITVAIVGLAYTWAVGMWGTVSSTSTTTTTTTTERMTKTVEFAVDPTCTSKTAGTIKFTLKASGIGDIASGDLNAFLDGSPVTTTPSVAVATITHGTISTSEFTYTFAGTKATPKLEISSPAGTISKTITCP